MPATAGPMWQMPPDRDDEHEPSDFVLPDVGGLDVAVAVFGGLGFAHTGDVVFVVVLATHRRTGGLDA